MAFYTPSRADQFLSYATQVSRLVRLRSLLFFEATVVHDAVRTALEVVNLKATGRSEEITNALQRLSDEIERPYNDQIRSLYGSLDLTPIQEVVLQAATEVYVGADAALRK